MKIVWSLRVSMLVVALSLTAVSQVHATTAATCTGGNEVAAASAQCLFTNTQEVSGTHDWWVNTKCQNYGDVAVKIDFTTLTDQFYTLDSENVHESGSGQVNAIYCCKDRGDLCNRSDLVTPANCKREFAESDAADSCTISGDPTVDDDHTECTFTAQCGDNNDEYTRTIKYYYMEHLDYCPDGDDAVVPFENCSED